MSHTQPSNSDRPALMALAARHPTRTERQLRSLAELLWATGKKLVARRWYRLGWLVDHAGDVPDVMEVKSRIRRVDAGELDSQLRDWV